MAKGVIKIALCMWSFSFSLSLSPFLSFPLSPVLSFFSFYSGPDLCAGGTADIDPLDIRFLLLACGVLFFFSV
ncbi:uncharacterized protein BDW47DRAFT_94872 [Aspergillus candidus]|uniref:Uncharacterized protein n=1 Tax=Aspergillus candidus TaxID=41067 RepID=A0A2I2EYK6_ASPCN|nr:hypothetical protein BDW47DRAFT_94872 [Aspergillus candidus]PLB33467.1 hypothetical protein BDW47DRAFT_94872 [Aspergillus candidus]